MTRRLLSIVGLLGLAFSLLLVTAKVAADDAVATPARLYFPTVSTVAGNPNGKVTLVEFFDYNCGYCHQMPQIFDSILKSNPNVRIVYRDYPVLGPESVYAARAAVAAATQGKYMALHNALFNTRNPLSDENVNSLAQSVGVDTQKLTQAMSGNAVNQQLRTTVMAASRLGLNGVPVVVVAATPNKNQKTVSAYVLTAPSVGELQSAIDTVSKG